MISIATSTPPFVRFFNSLSTRSTLRAVCATGRSAAWSSSSAAVADHFPSPLERAGEGRTRIIKSPSSSATSNPLRADDTPDQMAARVARRVERAEARAWESWKGPTLAPKRVLGEAFNASAASVQAALQALSTVGPGNVTVTGSSPSWTVTFTGALSNTNVPQMTGALTLAFGVVSVDGFEPITFSNKTTLTIKAATQTGTTSDRAAAAVSASIMNPTRPRTAAPPSRIPACCPLRRL